MYDCGVVNKKNRSNASCTPNCNLFHNCNYSAERIISYKLKLVVVSTHFLYETNYRLYNICIIYLSTILFLYMQYSEIVFNMYN